MCPSITSGNLLCPKVYESKFPTGHTHLSHTKSWVEKPRRWFSSILVPDNILNYVINNYVVSYCCNLCTISLFICLKTFPGPLLILVISYFSANGSSLNISKRWLDMGFNKQNWTKLVFLNKQWLTFIWLLFL